MPIVELLAFVVLIGLTAFDLTVEASAAVSASHLLLVLLIASVLPSSPPSKASASAHPPSAAAPLLASAWPDRLERVSAPACWQSSPAALSLDPW